MRARALLGGGAFLFLVALWHRAPPNDAALAADGRSACTNAGLGEVCGAVAGLATTLKHPLVAVSSAGRLPPTGVPGALDPAVTQANIDVTICRPGYARSRRPPYAVTGPLKRRLMAAQHPGEAMADYELDHLVPISLGGAPLDARDLWLQPRSGQANAGDKNVLAYVLWRRVCEHRVPLANAQRAISRDWIGAYGTYATPENVARYHFRHATPAPAPPLEG